MRDAKDNFTCEFNPYEARFNIKKLKKNTENWNFKNFKVF